MKAEIQKMRKSMNNKYDVIKIVEKENQLAHL